MVPTGMSLRVLSLRSLPNHLSSCHFGYLRRSEITTWARDGGRPNYQIKNTVKITRGERASPDQFHTANVLPGGEPEVVELVALTVLFTRIIFLWKSWTVKTTPEADTAVRLRLDPRSPQWRGDAIGAS